ncbi:hypothetical protein [Microbacterium sp. NPDC057650]|uniref:hypothetical protein n=1 Tax=unclassified Microbacterium TaxID=2609290 RepID=UPI00366F634C
MYEQSFFHGRITAIETEHATRAAERDRMLRERLGVPEYQDGLIRRMRAARAARRAARAAVPAAAPSAAGQAPGRPASVRPAPARDITPCADCPAAA